MIKSNRKKSQVFALWIAIGVLIIFSIVKLSIDTASNNKIKKIATSEFGLIFPEYEIIDCRIGPNAGSNSKYIEIEFFDSERDTTDLIFMRYRELELDNIYDSDLEKMEN